MAIYPPKTQKRLVKSPFRSNLDMVNKHLSKCTSTKSMLSKARVSGSSKSDLNMTSTRNVSRCKRPKDYPKPSNLKNPITSSNNSTRTTSTSHEHYKPFGKQPPLHRKRPENNIWPSDKVIARIIELRDEIQTYREKEARIIPFEGKSHHLRYLEYELQLEDKKRQLALYGRCSG